MDEQYVEKLHRDMDGIRIDSGVPTETSSITDADVEETKGTSSTFTFYSKNAFTTTNSHPDDHALYEIRLTSRKGFGLFAIRDIPRGTRIIAEPALVAVPASAPDFEHAWKEFKKLTPEQYDAMAGLTYQLCTSNPGIPALVRQRQTNGKQYEGIALTALNVVVEDETKMRAIFSTNAVEMGPEGRYGHGLFLLSSRINHSCCPNVQQVYNATLGMNTIYASREIKQDEEILCSYIEYLRKDPEERTEALAQWRFKCDCTACKGPEVTVREGRRQKICELAAGLPKYGAGTLGFSTPNTPDKALAWAEERVGLLKKQGLEDMELASA